jgi:protein-S-isoprenylcysteine O-methyltransferase Ste14
MPEVVATRGVLAAWIVFVPLMFRFKERLLLAKFGDSYARYVQEVPAILPTPWRSSQLRVR